MFRKLYYIFLYLFKGNNKEFIILDTGLISPPLGIDGFDIYKDQSVAIRFFSNINTQINNIDFLMMTNVFLEPYPSVNMSISKGGEFKPQFPYSLIDSRVIDIKGWNPEIVTVRSSFTLEPGEFYWIILESSDNIGEDALWNLSGTLSFMSFSKCKEDICEWQNGAFSNSACISVKGV